MSHDPVPVTVRILDKEYRVGCQPEEQEGLVESARMLDRHMREIRQTGRVIGTDRIAVMAALNIAHELIQAQRRGAGEGERQGEEGQQVRDEEERRLAAIQERLADAVASQRQLDERSESV
jgi:cell division protein ZapA